MRVLTAALLAALVVVLSVIAYDLRRIARELEPSAVLSAGILSLGTPSTETKEQRVQRNMREQKEFRDELAAGLEANRRLSPSRR